jgi:restriction system-associated AAA family ATPase
MRLLSLKVERADSCGGLLDGLELSFIRPTGENTILSPICLLGPNGSGKSQFLQLFAEVFQAAWHGHDPHQERESSNPGVLFEIEYLAPTEQGGVPVHVRLFRNAKSRPAQRIQMERREADDWLTIEPGTTEYGSLLPSLIVGYTSGDNETLSLPFLVSRAGYASDVGEAAFASGTTRPDVPNNRLLLIDYGTHLEVLVANLLLASAKVRATILQHAKLEQLASCRCIIQLAHSAVPKTPRKSATRKGIQLTPELEDTIDALKRVATCWSYDEKTETYIFDYFVDDACREAFSEFFGSSISLYRAFHKLALLNDLAIPRQTRRRFKNEVRDRRFASRLPEPQDEDKVFRFEQVRFHKGGSTNSEIVDYVSLSDGEHQQAQIFGVFAMITDSNVLFLLDEPESHFNPLWRVKFVKRLLELPVSRGSQEVLLTSHAPFVPSDMTREHVLIFSKKDGNVSVRAPDVETFGATFDRILEHCFDVRPPISQMARDEIKRLQTEGTEQELKDAMARLGSSVEKAFLADRLRQLQKSGN